MTEFENSFGGQREKVGSKIACASSKEEDGVALLTTRLFSSQPSPVGHPNYSQIQSFITYQPIKMEKTERSETSAYKIQTPGNYPKENIQHTEDGKSLKSRILFKLRTKMVTSVLLYRYENLH